MKRIEIIVCDDHPLIAQGLSSFIGQKEDLIIVATATTARELRETLAITSADILLLDINLPDGNGLELCPEIKKKYPELKILALSNFNERSIILRMLHNGASGYLLKSSSTAEIEKAIRNIVDGNLHFGKEAQKILTTITAQELIEIPPVTKREKEVLKYLADGLTTPQIAEKMFVSAVTVDSHRKSLMQKFEVNKTVLLLQRAREWGMI
ncbi:MULTISPECIES: response regulator transcription factor [Sphingobacterium]|jgi:DNA-binding NarL/FixJ family response regulator|uniref:Response regulator transcription factor n=1 Tax=Sphingobacterium hotanense TaxID=649196 RepID=A0ABT7NL22_9SPHI|nr:MULTISPECIES: response regulator transcription factor [Sphingobacterium]MDM1047909.1 response regulator transcription factor [Sphingobacterium hotanense]VTP87387.1 Transcriptional regulatory protein devR (dosR) [Sphingobacterium daejeonense]